MLLMVKSCKKGMKFILTSEQVADVFMHIIIDRDAQENGKSHGDMTDFEFVKSIEVLNMCLQCYEYFSFPVLVFNGNKEKNLERIHQR